MTEIHLGSHVAMRPMLPLVWAGLICAGLVAAMVAAAWRWPVPLARARRMFLIALRGLVIVAVAMVLARPEVRWLGQKPLTTEVAFLVDATRSMSIRDAAAPADVGLLDGDGPAGKAASRPVSLVRAADAATGPGAAVPVSRIDAVRCYFLTSARPYAELAERCLINPYAFGTRTRPIGQFNPEPADPRTDIGDALRFVLGRAVSQEGAARDRAAARGGNAEGGGNNTQEAGGNRQDSSIISSSTMPMSLAAVVLVSDGRACGGAAQAGRGNRARGSAEDAALALAARGIRVHAVAVGSAEPSGRARDVAVRDLRAPDRVFVGNRPEVRVVVAALGMAGRTVPLVMEVDGKEVERRPVAIASNQQAQEIVFTPALDRAGLARLAVAVEPVDGELVTTNNRVETAVRVDEGGIRVLYLDGHLRPEGKYVGRAVGDAREMILDRRILVAARASEGGPTPADIDAAGVVILGDLPAAALPPATVERLAERARSGGLGVLVLGGVSSLGAGGWAATPLADVLPVAIRPGEGLAAGPIRFQPTAAGRRHFIFNMEGTPDAGAAGGQLTDFDNLPPLPGASVVGALHPTARLLAQTPDGRPLLAVRELARGRVAVLTVDATWQWILMADSPRGVDQHRRFWRQLVLWLGGRDGRPQADFWVATDRPRYLIADPDDPPSAEVTAHAPAGVVPRVRLTGRKAGEVRLSPISGDGMGQGDARGVSVMQGKSVIPSERSEPATARAVAVPGSRNLVLRAQASTGGPPAGPVDWRGTIPLAQAGTFTLTAEGEAAGAAGPNPPQAAWKAEAVFSVEEQNLELADILADHQNLRRIAQAGGGTFREIDDLAALLAALAADIQPRFEPAERRFGLAEGRAFLGVVLGLLALDWALRRKWRVA